MNKIIPTSDRIFMAVVGPSGCGKTNLIFRKITGNTFYPKFKNVIFLYHEMQPIYSQVDQHSNIVFKNSQTWSFLKILKIVCLYLMILVRKFLMTKSLSSWLPQVDTRTLMSFIFHNLYQQSKWSRTIDLNTTHIILFKSPRDVQQVEFLGKQLNLTQFLKNCYEIATRETFGHLLIDLDSNTSDCLRFCSNITEPGPSVFYIPSDKADITHISNEREKILYTEANGTFI